MAPVKSAADIVAEMRAALKISDPELDTSIGTTTRKILDVVGEQIAPAWAVGHVMDYVYAIDAKSGADLDDFCAMFGIYRFPAKRAIGVITFSRPTPASENISVPANSQVSTGTSPRVVFATVAAGTIVKGTKVVSVPVQAVVAGESGNLPAGSLTSLVTPLVGVQSAVSQSDAATGGTNAEADEALRLRFKRTLFRSLAGTEDMFLGLALEDTTPDDSTDAQALQANVIGASKRWREQVQVDGSGDAVSTLPAASAKYVFPGSSVVGTDIDNGNILTEGIHYTFDTGVIPPEIHSIDDNLEIGTVYDLDFEYVPAASRNDPAEGIANRVDIWVSGVAPQQASETTYYQPVAFNNTGGDPFNVARWKRLDAVSSPNPTAGNDFIQLAWGPIIEFPGELTIDGDTYILDTDYWVVHEDDGEGYSPESRFGLEWLAASALTANAQIALSGGNSYFYNRLPADVQARARKWKLVTTDVKAHAAKQVRLRLNIAIMYEASFERGVVQASVDNTLATWMSNLGFRPVVQISDLLAVIHGVDGVDNVRFLNDSEPAVGAGTDANSWGIEEVNSLGERISNYGTGGSPDRATDIVLAENEVPVLYDIRFVTKAQNTFTEPG